MSLELAEAFIQAGELDDALDNAPEGLHDYMRDVLTTEPRYETLAQALLG